MKDIDLSELLSSVSDIAAILRLGLEVRKLYPLKPQPTPVIGTAVMVESGSDGMSVVGVVG